MSLQNKKIEFACKEKIIELPKSAKSFIPDWYKNAPKPKDFDLKWITDPARGSKVPLLGLKHCVPFLDGMLTGYIAALWVDVFVDIEDNMQVFRYRPTEHEPIRERPIDFTDNLPVPSGFHPRRFTWRSPFYMKTPKGYSVLITHPINRDDLPFKTLSAVVDSDSIFTSGNIPFYIKENFTGIIKKGTPIFQIIPFKRDNWESIENEKIIEIGGLNQKRINTVLSGWYKNHHWKVKKYQ